MKSNNVVTYLEFDDSNWYVYWETDLSHLKETQPLKIWHITNNNEYGEYHYKPLSENIDNGKFLEDIRKISENVTEKDLKDIEVAARIFLKSIDQKYPK